MSLQDSASAVLAASAPGIGDLVLFSPEWVAVARETLTAQVELRADTLGDAQPFTICEVAHNPPWHHAQYGTDFESESACYVSPERGPGRTTFGNRLAWWGRYNADGSIEVHEGEIDASECDYKLECDHGILSCLARILNVGVDPATAAAAKAELSAQTKWVLHGEASDDQGRIKGSVALGACFATMHDVLAHRTMPRFVWMSPNWVATARHIITTRSNNPKFRDDTKREPMLHDVSYVFEETFTNPPRYVSPDGRDCGFWHVCRGGNSIVGVAPLPEEYGEPDTLTKGQYIPTLVGGRTVNGALNEEEQGWVAEHAAAKPPTFKAPHFEEAPTMVAGQQVKEGSTEMPAAMGMLMLPMHEELSLRSSGECVSDFDATVDDGGAPRFDRSPEYERTWLRYDKVDIYGQPLAEPTTPPGGAKL